MQHTPFLNTSDYQEKSISAVSRAVKKLRDEILLIAEEGIFLGSEEDLMARLEISRTTFRQAIRILEYEELVTIKRGVGGGFYTRSPTEDSVAHLAAVFLNFKRTPTAQVLKACAVLRHEAVGIIAASENMETRLALKQFLEKNQGFYCWPDRRRAIRVINGFHQLIAKLSENVALALFMNVIKMFGNRSESLIFTTDRLKQHSDVITQIAGAVAQGNVAHAQELTKMELAITLKWLETARE